MTVFRPCIDLHKGVVKQIVGASLDAESDNAGKTNFAASLPSEHYARMFREDNLRGGHVIMLGPGNDESALSALSAWPLGLQVGGGINLSNALHWLDECKASHVIVTSFLFPNGDFSLENLRSMSALVGASRLVVDLSCKRNPEDGLYYVATNKWTTMTTFQVSRENVALLESYCAEFLIHACDVEGLCAGVDTRLIEHLTEIVSIPCTYAGGADSLETLDVVNTLSRGKVDITYGSALDIYGGKLSYKELVKASNRVAPKSQ